MCETGGMKSINVEMLMNHSTGVTDSYYRPREQELLEDYLIAVENLTIIKNNKNDNNNKELIEKEISQKNKDALTTMSDQIIMLMREVEILKNKK